MNRALALLFLGIFSLSSFSEVTAQDTLKVVSYNIFNAQHPDKNGESTLKEIADFISEEDPDFVALQEVDSATHRLAKLNGGRYFSLADSLAERTGMHASFGKALDFDGGGYGIAMLSRKPINTQKVQLPNPKDGEPRVLLTTKLSTDTGQKLIFAATHLDHQYEENRLRQVDVFNELLLKKNKLPVILAGDFNFEPGDTGYRAMDEKWIDVADQQQENIQPTYPAGNPKKRIDYIWLSKNVDWKLLDYQIYDVDYSDHLPVVAMLVVYPATN